MVRPRINPVLFSKLKFPYSSRVLRNCDKLLFSHLTQTVIRQRSDLWSKFKCHAALVRWNHFKGSLTAIRFHTMHTNTSAWLTLIKNVHGAFAYLACLQEYDPAPHAIERVPGSPTRLWAAWQACQNERETPQGPAIHLDLIRKRWSVTSNQLPQKNPR